MKVVALFENQIIIYNCTKAILYGAMVIAGGFVAF